MIRAATPNAITDPQHSPQTLARIITTGGHFSTAFWFPAIGRTIHFDTYKGYKLYELMKTELMPFLTFCSEQAVEEPLRKDSSSGIEQQLEGTLVCSVTAIRFLYEAFEKLKQINYAEFQTETSPQQRQEALFAFLAGLKTCAATYGRWRQQASEDLDLMITEYTEYRKRKAKTSLTSTPKKQATTPPDGNGAMDVDEPLASQPIASGLAVASQLPSSSKDDSEDEAVLGGDDSEDEAVLGGKAGEPEDVDWSISDLSQSPGS